MDPISQGTVGATLAQTASSKDKVKAATWMGVFGGLAPDLDIFIFSPTDPLLFLEFHRQFTHSLFFIPFGALIVAAVMHRIVARGLSFREAYLFCFLGYATHGLLDACTTYGTQLFWPFSSERFAWNNVSIIDPVFTFPILGLVITGVLKKRPFFAQIALVWAVSYLCFGIIQRDRAVDAGWQLAASRGHTPTRLEAKPGFANMVLWKVVYETEDKYYVDAIRVGIDSKVFPGDNAIKLDLEKHFTWLDHTSQQAKDIERFRWFSNNYLALDPKVSNRIIDVRYSVVPNEIEALWAIDLVQERGNDEHVDWRSLRTTDTAQTERWLGMLLD